MAIFVYKARDSSGKLVAGEEEGLNPDEIRRTLAGTGLYLVSISPKGKGQNLSFGRLLLLFQRFQPKDLINLTRQLEVMHTVGMPMDRVFSILINQTQNEGLKTALDVIQKDVSSGVRLSEAFKKHPKYFNVLFVSMVEAGESGGILDKTLHELTTVFEKEYQLKTKVKSATLYPRIVLGAIGVASWIILTFVLPRFESFYAKLGAGLPLPSRILIAVGGFLSAYWFVPLLIGGGAYIAWKRFMKTKRGQWWVSWTLLRVPIFGKMFILSENARFAHLIASLYKSGLPFLYALDITANTLSNACFTKELRLVRERIEMGSSLAKALEPALYFTPMVREMCSIGEQTGKLEETLGTTASFYDEELDYMVRNITTLIEPILLFFMFGMVLLLALAVYLPIWNMSSAVLAK